MTPNRRPTPISVLAVYLFASSIALFLSSVLVPFSSESIHFLSAQPGLSGWLPRHLGGTGMKLLSVGLAIVFAGTSVGLWNLREWGRVAACVELVAALGFLAEWV